MGQAIGQMLPAAVGVALSPLPIVAVVLMLVTPRGRANGLAFVLGWWVGLAIVGAIVLSVSKGAGATDNGEPATWVDVLKLVLGLLLLLVVVSQWRGRPHEGEASPTPKWMGALDTFTPPKAGGAGVVLSALNPKNLLLAVAGAAAIAGTGISGGRAGRRLGDLHPRGERRRGGAGCHFIRPGDRSREILDRLKDWMAHNNAAIMATLLLIIGVKLIGDAIAGFS
jgi:threonine/homoserine/homoserine lactone efflux protein